MISKTTIRSFSISMSVRILLFMMLFLSLPLRAADAPRVVVSIAPVHSLVSGVMAGVATPELLVKGAVSPHSYMLKPSQMGALQRADLIIWNGESVESFIPRTLRSLNSKTRVIKLAALPGMTLLPTREGGVWGEEEGDHHHHDDVDGHLWLDPNNAKVMVAAITTSLSEIDPAHAAQYRHNSEALLQQLEQLARELDNTLAPVRNVPYLVFHDGYHYFEARYRLNAVGAISVDPERKPGAKRLSELTAIIKQRQVRCLFSEPQYSASTVQSITAGSGVKSGVLDPLGSTLPAGPELYFRLMRGLGASLSECLR
jgi:zinc transport system substrate-binding protein